MARSDVFGLQMLQLGVHVAPFCLATLEPLETILIVPFWFPVLAVKACVWLSDSSAFLSTFKKTLNLNSPTRGKGGPRRGQPKARKPEMSSKKGADSNKNAKQRTFMLKPRLTPN